MNRSKTLSTATATATATGMLLLLLSVALAACGADADQPEGLDGPDNTPEGKPIVIGADLDTTGPAASYNKQVQEGIELAIEVVNRGGGVLDRPLELVAENSASDPAKAPATYNALIDAGAVAAIGYVTVGIAPVKQIIDDAQLLTVAAANTSAGLVEEAPNDYLYSLLPTAEAYAEVFCGAFEEEGHEDVALFHDDAPGVVLLVDLYKDLFKQCLPDGFVTEESAALDTTDFAAPVARLKDSEPDAVLTVSVGGTFQAQSESALDQALPDVPRFSIGAFDGQPDAWKVAQPGSLEGLVAVRPFTEENPRTSEVAESFRKVEGDDFQLAQTHLLGYESVMLIVQALEGAGAADDPKALNQAFRSIQGHESVLGQEDWSISFGADKHVGSDSACGLVLAEYGSDNTIDGLWDGYQQSC